MDPELDVLKSVTNRSLLHIVLKPGVNMPDLSCIAKVDNIDKSVPYNIQ